MNDLIEQLKKLKTDLDKTIELTDDKVDLLNQLSDKASPLHLGTPSIQDVIVIPKDVNKFRESELYKIFAEIFKVGNKVIEVNVSRLIVFLAYNLLVHYKKGFKDKLSELNLLDNRQFMSLHYTSLLNEVPAINRNNVFKQLKDILNQINMRDFGFEKDYSRGKSKTKGFTKPYLVENSLIELLNEINIDDFVYFSLAKGTSTAISRWYTTFEETVVYVNELLTKNKARTVYRVHNKLYHTVYETYGNGTTILECNYKEAKRVLNKRMNEKFEKANSQDEIKQLEESKQYYNFMIDNIFKYQSDFASTNPQGVGRYTTFSALLSKEIRAILFSLEDYTELDVNASAYTFSYGLSEKLLNNVTLYDRNGNVINDEYKNEDNSLDLNDNTTNDTTNDTTKLNPIKIYMDNKEQIRNDLDNLFGSNLKKKGFAKKYFNILINFNFRKDDDKINVPFMSYFKKAFKEFFFDYDLAVETLNDSVMNNFLEEMKVFLTSLNDYLFENCYNSPTGMVLNTLGLVSMFYEAHFMTKAIREELNFNDCEFVFVYDCVYVKGSERVKQNFIKNVEDSYNEVFDCKIKIF